MKKVVYVTLILFFVNSCAKVKIHFKFNRRYYNELETGISYSDYRYKPFFKNENIELVALVEKFKFSFSATSKNSILIVKRNRIHSIFIRPCDSSFLIDSTFKMFRLNNIKLNKNDSIEIKDRISFYCFINSYRGV